MPPVTQGHGTDAPRPTFRAATLNIRHALPPKDAAADVRRLMGQADLICLQEMGGRRGILEELCATHQFGMLMLDIDEVTGESATPILWRDSVFAMRRPDYIQGTKQGEDIPRKAAGKGTKLPAKFWTAAHLIHRETGRTLHVYSGHLPASQHLPDMDHKMRRLADQMVENLCAGLVSVQGPTLVAADWNNVRPTILGDGALVKAGLLDVFGTEDPKRATFKRRDIDRIFFRSPVLTCTDVDVLDGYASDHRPLVATFELSPREVVNPPHACPTCGLVHDFPAARAR